MSDGFAEMIHRARAFFRDLADTNTREFYEARKEVYTAEIRKPAELLADLLAEDLARATGRPHAPKVFRIQRDVRFSKDKTPYNTHLHLLWSRPGPATAPAWFFGAAPAYVTYGMGLPGLEKDDLATYRRLVDTQGDALAGDMEAARDAGRVTLSDWGPPPLKRVPNPYDADHPHGDLLKRKAFILHAPLPDGWEETGLVRTLGALTETLLPLWRRLDAAFPG
jgi:uncharacterized protein (TIGR02453 family)